MVYYLWPSLSHRFRSRGFISQFSWPRRAVSSTTIIRRLNNGRSTVSPADSFLSTRLLRLSLDNNLFRALLQRRFTLRGFPRLIYAIADSVSAVFSGSLFKQYHGQTRTSIWSHSAVCSRCYALFLVLFTNLLIPWYWYAQSDFSG